MSTSTQQLTESKLGHCLVTGAAGFVGRHLVAALLERGLQVRALVRNTPLAIEHPNLECFKADIQDAEKIMLACQGIDTVFHTAAIVALMGGSAVTQAYRDQAYAINLGGAENLLSGCRTAGVRRLVHTSSVDVCFNYEEDMQVAEDAPYASNIGCVYTETKIEAEKAILAANQVGGLMSCALRPDGIWGEPGNIMLDTMLEKLRAGQMVSRIGGQAGHHDHVHVVNLVHAHILAAEGLHEGSPVCGRAYFISDGEPAAMFDFVKPFFEGMGYKVPRMNIPAAPLRKMMLAWQWMHFKFGISEPMFTPHELNKLVISYVISSDAASRDFGYRPILSVADGMTGSIKAYLASAP